MTVRTPGRRAMKARCPFRPTALAVALALAGAASPAFALGCKLDRDGDSVVLSRNPLELPGNYSYYGFGSNRVDVPYDATGLDRLEVRNCLVDGILHDALVTDRPIELVYDNGDVRGDGKNSAAWNTTIDLHNRTVVQGAGTGRNRFVIGAGGFWSFLGPSGPVPLDVVFDGGKFGGGGLGRFVFDPAGVIRDDTLTVNGGVIADPVYLGGGNDRIDIRGGDSSERGTIYGDGGHYAAADLNAFGNRFDDTFTLTGGRIDTLHGDSGDGEAVRDATGRYTQDGSPAGNDHFVLDGGWVRDLMGDDGDDHLDLRGTSSLYEFRGGFGSDTVDVAAGASLDHVYAFEGDSGSGTALDIHQSRNTDVDVIRFHGQVFAIASDHDHGCASGNNCSKHVDVHGFERIELLDGARASLYAAIPGLGGRVLGDGTQAAGHSLLIDASSSLATRNNGLSGSTLHLSVVNNGTIDLGQDAAGDTLDVSGDWSGGGRVLMSTVFAGDTSATDRLRIYGNASGRTVLDIAQATGSVGAQTVDGILVVDTRGTSTADAFVLAAPITTANGLWQYRLEKASTGINAGRFVLTSAVPAKDPPTTPPTTPPPTTPPGGTPPPDATPPPSDGNARLLAPTVATVAGTGTAAQALIVDGIADADARATALRDRTGAGHGDAPIWLRARGDSLRAHGERFGEDLRRMSLQAGIDLQQDDDVTRGVMVRVAHADGDIEDRLRPTLGGFATALSPDVGDVRLRAYTLGGYQTLRFARRLSLDVTAEAGRLQARMSPENALRVDTDGWAAALSTTLAGTFGAGDWTWQPQAQLIAAHTSLDGLDGSVSSDRLTQNALRGRVGLRLSSRGDATTRVYGVANLWRDLRDANDAVFHGGSDSTSVQAGSARSWAEVGVGLAGGRGDGAWFVDLRSERGIGAGGREAMAAQAGINLRW